MIGYQALPKNAPLAAVRKPGNSRMPNSGRPRALGRGRGNQQMAHFDPGHNEMIRKAQGLGEISRKAKPKRKPAPKGIQKSISGTFSNLKKCDFFISTYFLKLGLLEYFGILTPTPSPCPHADILTS